MNIKNNFLAKILSWFQNKYMASIKKIFIVFILSISFSFNLYSENITAAFLSIENMNRNPDMTI